MQFWNPAWTLERAGYGGAGGGMGGIRGITCLESDILATYPRDEVRGALLKRLVKINPGDSIRFEAGVDAGRAWQLEVYADNTLLLKTIVESSGKERVWKPIQVDLAAFVGKTVTLRLYQRVLLPGKTAGNALWRNLQLK